MGQLKTDDPNDPNDPKAPKLAGAPAPWPPRNLWRFGLCKLQSLSDFRNDSPNRQRLSWRAGDLSHHGKTAQSAKGPTDRKGHATTASTERPCAKSWQARRPRARLPARRPRARLPACAPARGRGGRADAQGHVHLRHREQNFLQKIFCKNFLWQTPRSPW